ncbi:MAG: excinuclease ABC subunit C [Chitinophagaceae bacterium]|jgi:excinuclease ABC subunit C|nr:excinuclease ABC subunit C [Chitinophagaceae bacterium]
MTLAEFQLIAKSLPHYPGIYKYFDVANELIYVGKAKNLRKRISSYFNKTLASYKTHELVNRIRKIEFTIVDSEQDAFLLENSLIKQFQPRFNINLKDDKSYPFIVIRNEPFPRIYLTRRLLEDGSEYLGPFTSIKKLRDLLEFIKYNIPLRTCTLNLSQKNIEKGKFKVCLEYHLGNCKGPCENLQSIEEYQAGLQQVKNLLKGNLSPVIQQFKHQMKEYVQLLEFEKAARIKKKIEYLENYKARSVVVSNRLDDIDVFSIIKQNDIAYVNFLMVTNGTISQTKTIKVETHLDETAEEILSFTIAQLRSTFKSESKEIIVPFTIDYPAADTLLTIPKAGEKKKLLDLSEKNVNYFIEEQKQKEDKSSKHLQTLEQLRTDLQLSEIPVRIECFDNSNFQGSYPVSAMVSFLNGEPDKSNYRHFNVKTVEGINDFASMKEAVYRRYKRLQEEETPFPNLVIIDGGKGQLNAAIEALKELEVLGKTTVIGLAKNEEEIFFSGDKESLKLPYQSAGLQMIRRIRDEVHRFGINFHRNKRSKGTFKNEIEDIKGIGKATAESLLKHFRSIKNIKDKSIEELAEVVGLSKARVIKDHFQEKND